MKNTLKKLLISFYSVWASVMIILLVVVFSSCSTTKKVAKTKSDIALTSELESKKKVDETTNVQMAASGEAGSSKKTETAENKSKVTETRTTKFDTNKPIVPGTGKPPVAEETVKTEREISSKDTKEVEELTAKYNLQVKENKRLKQSNDSILSIKAKESSKSDNQETTSFTWWRWFLAGACMPVVIGLLVKFVPFSKVFVWILKIFKVKS